MIRRRLVLLALVPALLAGCGSGATPGGSAGEGSPVTLDNCGERVVFEGPPERVVLLESAPVTVLDGLGVLDRVVSRAGTFPPVYYSERLNDDIDAIPLLSEDIDASGHLMLSAEVVIALQPDLVLGLPDGLTREGLRDAGANVLIQPTYCGGSRGETTFDTLFEQIRDYGAVFDRANRADALVDSLRERVQAVRDATRDEDRTVAVLYPSVGGGPLYAYGTASMAHPQVEAAGLENVFADVADRVFEVGVEELIARDPDVLILLGQTDDPDAMVDEVRRLPGSDSLAALSNGDVLVHWFNFTEPPSPLVVDGLERIAAHFGSDRS